MTVKSGVSMVRISALMSKLTRRLPEVPAGLLRITGSGGFTRIWLYCRDQASETLCGRYDTYHFGSKYFNLCRSIVRRYLVTRMEILLLELLLPLWRSKA